MLRTGGGVVKIAAVQRAFSDEEIAGKGLEILGAGIEVRETTAARRLFATCQQAGVKPMANPPTRKRN